MYKHNGDVGGALSDNSMKNVSFDFKDIRKMVDESMAEKEKTKTIELKKK